MKRIVKCNNGGDRLLRMHQNPPLTYDDAKRRWKNFRGKGKEKVRSDLSADQFGLCAYTELRFDLYGYGFHIEHIRPRSSYPEKTFEYANLLLCALNDKDLQLFAKDTYFGGWSKNDQFDEVLFISCIDEQSELFFSYLSNGKVEPDGALTEADKQRAQYTIDILNLNSTFLVSRRRIWLDELDREIDARLGLSQQLNEFAQSEMSVDADGTLQQFYSSTWQRFKRLNL